MCGDVYSFSDLQCLLFFYAFFIFFFWGWNAKTKSLFCFFSGCQRYLCDPSYGFLWPEDRSFTFATPGAKKKIGEKFLYIENGESPIHPRLDEMIL